MRRRILLEIEFPDVGDPNILSLLVEIAEFLDDLKKADLIVDYGLGLEVPQQMIKELPRDEVPSEEPTHGAAEEV